MTIKILVAANKRPHAILTLVYPDACEYNQSKYPPPLVPLESLFYAWVCVQQDDHRVSQDIIYNVMFHGAAAACVDIGSRLTHTERERMSENLIKRLNLI